MCPALDAAILIFWDWRVYSMQKTVQMKTQKEENTKRKIERKQNYKEFKKIRYHLAKYEEGMACSF